MTIYRTESATAQTELVKLTDTNTTDIVATLTNSVGLKMIHCANITGTAATIDLEVYDGTTSYYLTKGESVAANDRLTLNLDIQLNKGQSIRATAGTGNAIDVTATYLTSPTNRS